MIKGLQVFRNITQILKKDEIKKFIRNIWDLLFYKLLASVLGILVGIITAKELGPEKFGKISIIGNLSNFIIIPFLFGVNNSMYKYLPGSNEDEALSLISTSLVVNFISTIVFSILYFFSTPFFVNCLKIDRIVWQLAIIYTVCFNFYLLIESFLRGKQKFLLIGRLKFITSFLFFLLITILFYFFGFKNLYSFVISFIIVQIIFSFFAVIKLKITHFRFSLNLIKKIYKFGIITSINSLFTAILFSLDVFIINYFCSEYEVGIYSAYQGFIKNIFSILFFEVFSVVLLPTIVLIDKIRLIKELKKYILIIFIIITIPASILTIIFIYFYGSKYPLNFIYAIIVSSSISFYTIFQIFNSIFFMEGTNSAKHTLIPFIIVIPFSICLQIFLTIKLRIIGTMIAILITYFSIFISLLFIINFYIKKYLKKETD